MVMGLISTGTPARGVPPNQHVTSRSGQFIVTDSRVNPAVLPSSRSTQLNGRILDLTAETLAVSCERVKKEILSALGMRDEWRSTGHRTGKIYLSIDPTVHTNKPLAVFVCAFEQGWQFRILVPPVDTEDRLVRVLAQAILTELASRNDNTRTGEPPLWLVEGLTRWVLDAAPVPSLLQPDSRTVTDLNIGAYLTEVREKLSREIPLGFHELSQPDISRMGPQEWELYGASAHLFLRELCRMPEGRVRLVQWLTSLQEHWNWQPGFLEAFEPVFMSLLDVEKWWALTLAHFTSRNPVQAWPPDVVLRKLEAALQPVTVLPLSGNQVVRMRLADVITQWEYGRQLPVLRQVLQQMQIIASSAPPDLGQLAMRYAGTIERYLSARARAGFAPPGRGQSVRTMRRVEQDAIEALGELDHERNRFSEGLAAIQDQ
jgi:hypothetical protein